MIKFVNFRASDIEPNPNEVLYWVDLNEDPTGGSIKYWNEKGYWLTIRVLEGTLHEFEERITNWVTEELQEQTEWVEDLVHQFDGRIAIVEGDILNLYTVKLDKLIPGYGIEITEDNTINCTVDLSLYRVVAELPTEDIDESKIYIVFDPDGAGTNTHEEYVYVDGKWELLGKYADYASITELQQEIADRKAADQQLQLNIDAEIERATNKETVLLSSITKEISDRLSDITRVEQLINDESQIRLESIAQTNQAISEEVDRAIAAEEKLTQDLNAEIERSTTIDGTHTNKISALETKATELGEEIDAEVSRATAKETELNEAITNEISRATLKESEIEESLNDFKLTKGEYNGLASLDENGRVPSTQLPSFVDDVVEADTLTAFPETGEPSKIYIAKDTNMTYRWSGTQYVNLSSSLALGETSSTAYAGDKGKANRDALLSFPKDLISIFPLVSAKTNTVNLLGGLYITKEGIGYSSTKAMEDRVIPAATTTTAGVMTAADKAKLDAVELNIIDATLEAKDYAEDLVGNIQVGGRNLLLNSGTSFSTIGGTKSLNLSTSWYSLRGKQVTISFDYEYSNVSTGSKFNQCRFGAEQSLILNDGTYNYEVSAWVQLPQNSTGLNGKGRHSRTVIPSNNLREDNADVLSFYIQVLSGTVTISNFKMELGNKATDWSPAPEDITSSIDSVNNTLTTYREETDSRLVVLEDKISATVSSETLQQTKEEILNTAAQDATNKINSIQVGGVNILRGTKTFDTKFIEKNYGRAWAKEESTLNGNYVYSNNTTNTGEFIGFLFNLEPTNKETIISFWAKAEITSGICAYNNFAGTGATIAGNVDSSEWKQYYMYFKNGAKFNSKDTGYRNGCIEFYYFVGKVYISSIKVEYGNKATDWSPAPEDLELTFTDGTDGSFTVTKGTGEELKVNIGKPATAGTADTATDCVKKAGDTMTGLLTINNSQPGIILDRSAPGNYNPYIRFTGNSKLYGELGASQDGKLQFWAGDNTGGAGAGMWSTVWHENNDGPGSGLDADTLDGLLLADLKVRKYQLLDLSGLDKTKFYPVMISEGGNTLDIWLELSNPGNASTAEYNKNLINCLIHSNGWDDSGELLLMFNNYVFDTKEITIGAIGFGDENGGIAVWLRGGMTYSSNCTTTLTLKTTDYTLGTEKYTVGTNIYGGTNVKVTLKWKNDDANRKKFDVLAYHQLPTRNSLGIDTDDAVVFAKVTASGGFWKESDKRLKSNIKPLLHTIEQITSIPTVEFNMNDKHLIGTIAQDIETVVPEVVSESDGIKKVEYSMMGVLAIEGIKLLKQEIEDLKKEIELLKNK